MDYQRDQAIEILSRTPAILRAMLAGLSDPWVRSNYGENTFSPFDIVGHLIHGEREDWIPRARIILEHGEAGEFAPFDRYAMFEASRGRTIVELLDTFEQLRVENIAALRGLPITADSLARRGTHAAFGVVTLGQLLATWVAHDLNHIAQTAKAMAFQYHDEVGPWREYLSILRPPLERIER